jgi:uncharacterized OsmC-like protein
MNQKKAVPVILKMRRNKAMKKIASTYYEGNLRVGCVHLNSGDRIFTDAPKDNQGEGKAFSPTDLLCTSLASCILTIMGIKARDNNIDMSEATIDVSKEMKSNPRRIGAIDLLIDMSEHSHDEREKRILEEAAQDVPVALSLSEDLVVNVDWKWNT